MNKLCKCTLDVFLQHLPSFLDLAIFWTSRGWIIKGLPERDINNTFSKEEIPMLNFNLSSNIVPNGKSW